MMKKEDNIVIKYYMLGAILVVALIGGLLPLVIKKFITKKFSNEAKKAERRLMEGLNIFTSGIMLYC